MKLSDNQHQSDSDKRKVETNNYDLYFAFSKLDAYEHQNG